MKDLPNQWVKHKHWKCMKFPWDISAGICLLKANLLHKHKSNFWNLFKVNNEDTRTKWNVNETSKFWAGWKQLFIGVPANIYLFKINNRNIRKRCEIYSNLTMKTPERDQRRSRVFIVKFECISNLFLLFLM